ncbi:chitobiase/beta-hexosaminidase C-terminal domain-containing protein [Candidatus Dojkabacteria bacterium]|nr:chitobiase/beta-hexosaminidase C-terminal domain-containing protein [Candidatus Dojkabacteria bacterium]
MKKPPVLRVALGVVLLSVVGLLVFRLSPLYALTLDASINPTLDISRFSPYKVYIANIYEEDETVASVSIDVNGINGNTVSTSCWNYYVDGVCNPEHIGYNLTYNGTEDRWESPNIYPDQIYPEVYFAPSDITWYNAPLGTPVFRETYSVFRYENPFEMVSDMSFWIEFNAIPNAGNSSDLEVYLVGNAATLSTLSTDWRSSGLVELVGTLNKDATFHHTHSVNSSHHLVSLQTNADGTIGVKNLNVSNNFWIILYSKSPNVQRGWTLRYQPASLCNHPGRWYTGNQFGWALTEQSGCPDSHIHVARRSTNRDGVNAGITVNYISGGSDYTEKNFYFGPLPNLAPNLTSFTNPVSGAFSGMLNITWDPASDANNDTLTYTIDLLNANQSFNQNIITDTLSTSTIFDTETISDGSYILKGTIYDNGTPSLCTGFYSEPFNIYNTSNIATLSGISILSSNAITTLAKNNDTITLSFTSSITLINPTVTFYAGGYNLGTTVIIQTSPNHYTATVVISTSDREGQIRFDISADNLDKVYSNTTNKSSVYLDNVAPSIPTSTPVPGTYPNAIFVTLAAEGASVIRYTIGNLNPSCTYGYLYETTLRVFTTRTLNVIACDEAGNPSGIANLRFVINLTYTPTTEIEKEPEETPTETTDNDAETQDTGDPSLPQDNTTDTTESSDKTANEFDFTFLWWLIPVIVAISYFVYRATK